MSSVDQRNEHHSDGADPVDVVFSEKDVVDDGSGTSCRLCSEAEEIVRSVNIRRLTLLVDKIVDLSNLDIVLVPRGDEITEIICEGGVIARRLHATNIKVNGSLLADAGFVSTDPEGWLVVEGDMIADRIFGKDIVVSGTLSVQAMAAENVVIRTLFVGRLLDGVDSLIVRTEPHFDGEFWTRGGYIGSKPETILRPANPVSLLQFKERLRALRFLNGIYDVELFDRYRLTSTKDLTVVSPERLAELRVQFQASLETVCRQPGKMRKVDVEDV
jgi:hypothetical protein